MYLDETILQSRTTITLVDFIKKLWSMNKSTVIKAELEKDYKEIVKRTDKAAKKRNNRI